MSKYNVELKKKVIKIARNETKSIFFGQQFMA